MGNTEANAVTSGESKILEAMQKDWENIYEVAKDIDFQKRWTFDDYSNAAGKLFDEIAKIKVIEPQKYMFNYMLIKLELEIGDKNIGGFWDYLKRIKFAKPKMPKGKMDISALFVQDSDEIKNHTDEEYNLLWGAFGERLYAKFVDNGYKGKINIVQFMKEMVKKFDFAVLEKLALALAMPVEHFEVFLTKVLKRKVIDFYKREEVLLYLTLEYAEMAGELKLFEAYDKLKEMYGEVKVEDYSESVEIAVATIEYRKEAEEILKVDYETLFEKPNDKLKKHFQRIEIINKTQKVKRTEMREMRALWKEFSSEMLNSKILKDYVTDEYAKKYKKKDPRYLTELYIKGKTSNIVVKTGTKFMQTIYLDERNTDIQMCSKKTFESATENYLKSKFKPDAVYRKHRVEFEFFDEQLQTHTKSIVCNGPVKLWKEEGRDNSGKVIIYCKPGSHISKDTIILMKIDQERFWYAVTNDAVATKEGIAEVYIEPNGTQEQFDKLYYAKKLPALWNFRPMIAEFVVTEDTELKRVKETQNLVIPVEALCSKEKFEEYLDDGFVVGKMLEAKPKKLNVIHGILFDGKFIDDKEEIECKNLRIWKQEDKKGNIIAGTLMMPEALGKDLSKASKIEMKVDGESFLYEFQNKKSAKQSGKVEITVHPLCTEEEFDEKFYGGKLPAFYRNDQVPECIKKEHVQDIRFEGDDIEGILLENVKLKGVRYVASPKDNGEITVECMPGVQIPENKVIIIKAGNKEFRYRVKKNVEVKEKNDTDAECDVGKVNVEWSNVEKFKELEALGINGFFKTNRTFETTNDEIEEAYIDHVVAIPKDEMSITDMRYQATESALLRFVYGLSEDESLNGREYHGLSEWKEHKDFYLNHEIFRNTQITLNDLQKGRENPMDMRNLILTILFFLFTWDRIEDEDDAKSLIAKFERRADKILKKCSYQPFHRRGFAYDAFLGLLLNCQQPFYLYLAIWSEDLLKYAELEKNNE